MNRSLWLPARDLLVAANVSEASGFRSRARGLIGRNLARDETLMLQPCKQVHTFGMAYPIDVVFCDGGLRALHIACSMAPNRLSRLMVEARCAFELSNGAAASITLGDRLELRPRLSA